MEMFTEGLGFPEAPVLLPDGSFLCVEMTPETGHVSHISADGKSKSIVAKTGRPNGLAVDRNGTIWVAETAQRALLRLDMSGKTELVADRCGDERFLFPNDCAVGPDGMIYMTDSGVLEDDLAPGGELNPDWAKLDYDGKLFRIDPATGAAECITAGIQFANGLAFGPDGALYANETLTGNIYRFDSIAGRPPFTRSLWGNVVEHPMPGVLKGPDGMKFSADGRLFACVFGQGDVTVLARDGSVDRRYPTLGGYPTNLVFGPQGDKAIYVTERETGSLQRIEVGVDGLALHV